MKIYSFCEPAFVHCHPSSIDPLYVLAGEGGSFKLIDGKVIYEGYLSDYTCLNFYLIHGEVYRKYLRFDEVIFSNDSGKRLDLPQEFLDVVRPYDPFVGEESKFLATILNYPEKFRNSLGLFDVCSKTFVSKEMRSISSVLINGFAYGFDAEEKYFFKCDSALQKVWAYSPSFASKKAKTPLLIDNIIITFIGPEVESRQLVKGRSHCVFGGGVLVGLNDEDGSLIWKYEVSNAVDSYQLFGGVLYVVSLNEILLINTANGELINSIDTETSVPVDRFFGPSLYIDNSTIYYSHYDDGVILVFDRGSLALLRRIEMPSGYHVRGHDFHDRASGKQYFSLVTHTQYVAQGPVLEVDPQHLDEVLEFESKPDMDIKLDYSPDNAAEKELVIRITCDSLDDALRFGEIYTRDEAQRYSFNYMEMRFQDRPFTPEPSFNGIIRFQYSGCSQSKELVEEHLSVMEKRFSKWAEDRGFYSCTDKNQLTQLKAEYVA
ncbi:hypothetical protein [Microbulbifer sp. JMSA003]|uniref:hypothetical protein n=1 Tax=Microbulbifer sp. JMSA003 TaxID=3243369 RepID=UPI00403989C7